MTDNQQVKKRGGARKGAGRKPKTPETKCKQVYFYVPAHLIPLFKEKVGEILEELLGENKKIWIISKIL